MTSKEKDGDCCGDKEKEKIGEGGYSKVYKVKHKGVILARKDIQCSKIIIDNAINEVKLLKKLKNKNVVQLVDYFVDYERNTLHIYTKYYENGDLWDLIDRKEPKEEEILSYMRDLTDGLMYIHSKGIIHGDLKPGNILVGDENELIICDLGLSIDFANKETELNGTPNYIAPELWKTNPPTYSELSDIFSLGCIFYEIYSLRMLYDSDKREKIVNSILNNNEISFDNIYGNRNEHLENLIKNMVNKNPSERPNLKRVLEILEIAANNCVSYPLVYKVPPISRSSTSISYSSYDSASHYHCLVIGFYLYNESLQSMSLKDLCEMEQTEFNKKWKNDFCNILFPYIDQDNPPYSLRDSVVLKYRKNEYADKLITLIDRIKLLPNYYSSNMYYKIYQFISSIELSTDIVIANSTRKIPLYQRGGIHPSRWIYVIDVVIDNCPPQITSLYYERPDEGNRLLSVNGGPPFYHLYGRVQGSEGLSNEYLEKYKYGNWWCEIKDEKLRYVPVYERGRNSSKFTFIRYVPIEKEYGIKSLYYSYDNDKLLYINENEVASSRSKETYFEKISKYGWWEKEE